MSSENRKATCEYQFYRCCIDTKWNAKGGLSLGLFIFTPKDDVENAEFIRREDNVPYTACFVEYWASKWGELVTKEKAIWK